MGITWERKPLREGLQNLARSQKVAIYLDRRSNPDREISIAIDEAPLRVALRRIARKGQLGVGFVGPVVYIGPPLTCTRIATLAELRNEQSR